MHSRSGKIQRSSSKRNRIFGKDITNMPAPLLSKQAILQHNHNFIPNKPDHIKSRNVLARECFATGDSLLMFESKSSVYEVEKMVDEHTMAPWNKEEERDPVYDHAEEIQTYIIEQSELSVIQ